MITARCTAILNSSPMFKSEIRKQIKARKAQFSRAQLADFSQAITNRLLHHPRLKAAKTILLYYSLPDEVDTHELVNRLVTMGKQILLPVVIDGENLEVRHYRGSQDLREGSFHILEPVGEPFTAYDQIDLVVVPGVGFDAAGNRLGRGKGYYDRLLRQMPDTYKLGVCFDFQKVETIPTDQYDIQMHEVL